MGIEGVQVAKRKRNVNQLILAILHRCDEVELKHTTENERLNANETIEREQMTE